jgi:ABC-type antimicrobial peptide transport system permease subunit
MQEIAGPSLAQPRLDAVLLGFFAAAALLLAVLGIYGVVSYSVSRRTQELGVRMALGARRGDVLRLVLLEGTTLAAIGVALGVTGALGATAFIRTWLFGVGRIDVTTFGAVAAGLVLIAVVASLVPARRATRVDPIVVMRGE